MINYIEESYYPTVEELLKLPIFSTSYVAAGKGGLDRIVSGINLCDNPDYAKRIISWKFNQPDLMTIKI